MPVISIRIDEHMEAKIVDLMFDGQDFTVNGGELTVGPVWRRLKEITFHFKPDLAELRQNRKEER